MGKLLLALTAMAEISDTEQKILASAEEVFQEKGYDGARMQEIAAHAGINKGLLHYYFKTKDKLFEAIFTAAVQHMISKIFAIMDMETSLEEKIQLIVDQYMAMILKNPTLPRFVLNELNKNADQFVERHFRHDARKIFASFERSVSQEVKAGRIRDINAKHLFMNIMSLMVFPFIGRPLLQVATATSNTAFTQMMTERRVHIREFVINAIRK